MVDAMIGQCEVDVMITMVSDHKVGSHIGNSGMVQVMITSVMIISAGCKKCDDGQCKDVMIASLVASVAQSHGRSDDGQFGRHCSM